MSVVGFGTYKEGDRCGDCGGWYWNDGGWHSLVPVLYADTPEDAAVTRCPSCVGELCECGQLLEATEALRAIAKLQPRMLATLQKHGVVFDGPLGADPKNFQHVAFSVYTTLCEADSIAMQALDALSSEDATRPTPEPDSGFAEDWQWVQQSRGATRPTGDKE